MVSVVYTFEQYCTDVLHIDLTILNKHTRSLTGTVSKLLRLKSSSLPSSLSFKLSFGILGFKVKVQRRPEPAVIQEQQNVLLRSIPIIK